MKYSYHASAQVFLQKAAGKHLLLVACLVTAGFLLLAASDASAQQCVGQLEPNLQTQAQSGTAGAGVDIIDSIFIAVNAILQGTPQSPGLAQKFYTGIVGNPNYITAVNSLILLYITVYGVMILLNLASHKTAEVVSRLFKVSIVWAIMTNGWAFFGTYVGAPVINCLNDMITQFAQAGGGNVNAINNNTGALDPAGLSMLYGSMTYMFSLRTVVALLFLLSMGAAGWFFVLAIIWGLVEFIFMIIGAIITYVKSIVGLTFLFGLAPIFFSFILFERTKQVFMGWVNQVLGFFLQPVLLFAFLGFYMLLLEGVLNNILFPPGLTDYCYVKWFGLGPFNIDWWRGITNGTNGLGVNTTAGGDWNGPSPVNIIDILYFLLLTHLGKNLSKFIEGIAQDISGGTTPGLVRGDAVSKWFKNTVPGLHGRGPGALAADFAKGAFAGAGNLISHRKEIGKGMENAAKAATRAAFNAPQAARNAKQAVLDTPQNVARTATAAKDAIASAPRVARDNIANSLIQARERVNQAAQEARQLPNKVGQGIASRIDATNKAVGEAIQRIEAAPEAAAQKLEQAGKQFMATADRARKDLSQAPKHVRDGIVHSVQDAGKEVSRTANEIRQNIVNAPEGLRKWAFNEAAEEKAEHKIRDVEQAYENQTRSGVTGNNQTSSPPVTPQSNNGGNANPNTAYGQWVSGQTPTPSPSGTTYNPPSGIPSSPFGKKPKGNK